MRQSFLFPILLMSLQTLVHLLILKLSKDKGDSSNKVDIRNYCKSKKTQLLTKLFNSQ